MGQGELIVTIVAAIVAIFLLSTGLVVFFIFFNRSKLQSAQREREKELEYIKELAAVEVEVQSQTLTDISRELHDDIGQSLTLLKLKIDDLTAADFQKAKSDLSERADETIAKVRSYSRSLNADRLKNRGLLNSLRDEMKRVQRTGHLKFIDELDNRTELPDKNTELVIYRIFQEFLNNTLKHAMAETITVKSHWVHPQFHISFIDDGIGFDMYHDEDESSGLLNVRTRAEMIGADYHLWSELGKGTSLILIIHTLADYVPYRHS